MHLFRMPPRGNNIAAMSWAEDMNDGSTSRSDVLRASPPMFESRLLDALSRVHPLVPVLIFGPLIVALAAWGFSLVSAPAALALLLGGYAFWTLFEYWLHRLVFHFEPEAGIGARLHWIIHGVHHDHPNDPLRLVMPPAVSVPLGALIFGVIYLLAGEQLAPALGAVACGGCGGLPGYSRGARGAGRLAARAHVGSLARAWAQLDDPKAKRLVRDPQRAVERGEKPGGGCVELHQVVLGHAAMRDRVCQRAVAPLVVAYQLALGLDRGASVGDQLGARRLLGVGVEHQHQVICRRGCAHVGGLGYRVRPLARMSASWSSIQSPGSREVMISTSPRARRLRSGGDMASAA